MSEQTGREDQAGQRLEHFKVNPALQAEQAPLTVWIQGGAPEKTSAEAHPTVGVSEARAAALSRENTRSKEDLT